MAEISLSHERCHGGRLPVHQHDRPHACLVIAGSMFDRQWKKSQRPATAGAFILNPPGAEHEIEAGPEGLSCIVIEWNGEMRIDAVEHRRGAAALLRVAPLVDDMHARNPARKAIADKEIEACLNGAVFRAQNDPELWLVEARAAIKSGAASVDHIAKWAGVHRSTLSRRFHECFGMSPEQYRVLAKLERAAEQVMGGKKIAIAAHEAGFADQSHLSRLWRKHFGAPPMQWMKRNATIVQ